MSKLARREEISGYLFISPWLIGFFIFTAGAVVVSLGLSFTKYEIVSPPIYIGAKNYIKAFTNDPLFWHSLLKVTLTYAVFSVPLQLVTGLVVALLMNQKLPGIGIFRTLYYLPSVVPMVAMAMLWILMLDPQYGLINYFLSFIGIKGPAWLYDTKWALSAFIIMRVWIVGSSMLMYLAGLQGIPTSFYEAADIDGANIWQKFWNITIPIISPIILLTLIMSIIASFQVFTLSYVMTEGGPGNATLFYVLLLYQNAFINFKMGYASALAWILFIIILGLTILILKSSASWVHYEGKTR